MPIVCKKCGGAHWTQVCLAAAQQTTQQQPEETQAPIGARCSHRPSRETDWILPQHEHFLDILERSSGAVFTGEDREFVLEGVRHGPYKQELFELGLAHNTRRPFPPDAVVRVGSGYELRIDEELIHHGSLWTTKSTGDRHREHLTNCVKESQAWREHKGSCTLDAVVDDLVQHFGDWSPGRKM